MGMKGHNLTDENRSSSSGNNIASRLKIEVMKMMKGRSMGRGRGKGGFYMVVVLVMLFVGLMVLLIKLRDRDKMLHLLIKDKDAQLFTLQSLLQKERQYAKETKRVVDEMSTKLYSLRTHKMELDNRISEMRSTISSMSDQQKTTKLALVEKDNEIKHKEAEIEDLKNRLLDFRRTKVWSVSAHDPSNPQEDHRNATDGGGQNEGQSGKNATDATEVERHKHQETRTELESSSVESGKQSLGGFKYTSGTELEIPNNTTGTGENHDNRRKAKAKKWKVLATHMVPKITGNSEENGSKRGRKFFKGIPANEREKRRESSVKNGISLSDKLQETRGLERTPDEQVGLMHREDKPAIYEEKGDESKLKAINKAENTQVDAAVDVEDIHGSNGDRSENHEEYKEEETDVSRM